MRTFKEVHFSKWAKKEKISDSAICKAAQEVAEGKVDADLGQSIFKKRVARPGQGSRSGWRFILGFKKAGSHTKPERIFFLFGFGKNEASTLSDDGHKALAIVAKGFIDATDDQIAELIDTGSLFEVVCNDNGKKNRGQALPDNSSSGAGVT